MVVCEGEKTEVNYFEEIRQESKLPTVHVRIIQSPLGTEPQQIVEGAEAEFLKSKRYERIFVVFDRDQHRTYADAIKMAEARNRRYRNDENRFVSFKAIVSVPCFELRLLLHFTNILAPMHRDEALAKLKKQLIGYEKGNAGTYAATLPNLDAATKRAAVLKQRFSRLPGIEAYTDVHELVGFMKTLKSK
ncbi:MAG: RloB family protein [Methylovirgula sp.]|uniref:RloB family protein n=1 Tax=Methylovirgula sp. TaxID=1978224 RepID=UPI00307659E9